MTNDPKLPENKGDDSINLVENLAKQGISVEAIINGMGESQIRAFLVSQYNLLKEKYDSLSEQLRSIKEDVNSDRNEASQRIERILALMTSNLAYIKQLIQLADSVNDRMTDIEKAVNKQELQMASLLDKQNRFAAGLTTMDKNSKTIVNEIAQLKAKDVDHDKFQFKVTLIATIVIGVAAWLMTGDNLAKITVFLVHLTGDVVK